MLYNGRLLTYKWICKINVIGLPICLLCPLIGIGRSSVFSRVFEISKIFLAHLVARRVKAFTLVSPKAVVLALHPFRDKVYSTIRLFLLINQLKSTLNMITRFNLKVETSFKVPLFPT